MSVVKEIRKRYSFSQTQLAAYLGISRSLLAMIESGQRELTTEALKKLNTLGMSYEQVAAKGSTATTVVLSLTEQAVMRRTIKKQLASTKNKINRLQLQLNEMLQAWNTYNIQAAGLKKIMAHTAKKATETDRQQLRHIQLSQTMNRSFNCNPMQQAFRQIKLQSLQLEATLLKQLLETPAGKLFSISTK